MSTQAGLPLSPADAQSSGTGNAYGLALAGVATTNASSLPAAPTDGAFDGGLTILSALGSTAGASGSVMPTSSTASADSAVPPNPATPTSTAVATSDDMDEPASTAGSSTMASVSSVVPFPMNMPASTADVPPTSSNASPSDANSCAPATSGTVASHAAAALPSSDGGATSPVANASSQSTGIPNASAGTTVTSSPHGLAATGSINAKTALGAVQQGRTAKASTTADHDRKNKTGTASSSALTSDGSEGDSTSSPVMASNSSPGDNQSDSQKAPVVDPTMLTQQQGIVVAAQGPSVTPNHPTNTAAGALDAGSSAAATQSQAAVAGSVPETGNMPAVSSAQLIQSVRHSEMRLGMQSEEFGNLSISTSVGRQVLSAQIATDHSELGRALAIHLPAMEQKLSTASGLQARVELSSGGSSSDTAFSQSSQGGRQGGNGSKAMPLSPGTVATVTPTTNYPVGAAAAGVNRLDIRV